MERTNDFVDDLLREVSDPDHIRAQIGMLEEQLNSCVMPDWKKAGVYTELVKYSLRLGDVEEARSYAETGSSLPSFYGWFWYGSYFQTAYLGGKKLIGGYSTLEEAVVGYSRLGGIYGTFQLGELFDKVGNVSQAIKYYLEVLKPNSCVFFQDEARKRLKVLLLE